MEFVYVVRRSDLFERDCPQGFLRLSTADFASRYGKSIHDLGFFVERRHAERDSSLKQVIPYCVTMSVPLGESQRDDETTSALGDSAALEPRILCLRRLPKQGETRLHGKRSIGIGGHINPVDRTPTAGASAPALAPASGAPASASGAPAASSSALGTSSNVPPIVLDGALRELFEELDCDRAQLVPVGILNDDSTPVGSVHVGVVFFALVQGETTIREQEAMEGEWSTWKALQRQAEAPGSTFESWSSLLLRAFTAEDVRTLAREASAPSAPRRDPASSAAPAPSPRTVAAP